VNIVSQSCDHTVQIVCVWRDILMDQAGTHTRTVIHQVPTNEYIAHQFWG